jgi:hypothetical protein
MPFGSSARGSLIGKLEDPSLNFLTEKNLTRTDKNVVSTDESLKNLIAVVDRYLSGRNGK